VSKERENKNQFWKDRGVQGRRNIKMDSGKIGVSKEGEYRNQFWKRGGVSKKRGI